MIRFIKKNKILFIAAGIVIIAGACLAVILLSKLNTAMEQQQIQTAVAESSQIAIPSAAPSPTGFSVPGMGSIISEKAMRRDHVIPSVDNTGMNSEAKTWKSIKPDNLDELKGKGFAKTVELTNKLFSLDIVNAEYKFTYYTDTDKDREDIVKVETLDGAIVCTLTVDTLDLIVIDYYFVPDKPLSASENDLSDFNTDKDKVPDENDRHIADRIAVALGTSASKIVSGGFGGYPPETEFETFDVTMADGKLIRFATQNNELYAVGVFPTQACLDESVYFVADVERDPSVVKLVHPQDFKEGQPGATDMTKDQAKNIYLSFLNLANGTGTYADPAVMTFYIDNSGARENYWHMEGNLMTMDITSKSKWLINLKCSSLWNPEHDLTGIDYDSMGGKEYGDYVSNIMSGIYGSSLIRVTENAVDAEDAFMADGTVYEFEFQDGKLQEVWYCANEESFMAGYGGWLADRLYINTVTGKQFTPQY